MDFAVPSRDGSSPGSALYLGAGISGECHSFSAPVGGFPDWLVPTVLGKSAAGTRPEAKALADAMVRALNDADHWQRLRHGAWETSRCFSPEAHGDGLLPILEAAAA
jgi:hypothetical protein